MTSINKLLFSSIWVRFWVIVVLSLPAVALTLQSIIPLAFLSKIHFNGEIWFLSGISILMYIVCLWTIFGKLIGEFKDRLPGIAMTLILSTTLLLIAIYLSIKSTDVSVFFFHYVIVADLLFLTFLMYQQYMALSLSVASFQNKLTSQANIKIGTDIKTAPAESIKKDEIVIVNPNEKIPCDGKVVEGISEVIEPLSFDKNARIIKQINDLVIAGTVCLEKQLTIRSIQSGKAMYLNNVIRIFHKAASYKSVFQKFLEKTGFRLFALSLTSSLLFFIIYLTILKTAVPHSIMISVSILAVNCFYILYIALPLVVLLSVRRLAEKGIVVNNRNAFEHARKLNTIIFDKTGTLTEGRFGVIDIVLFSSRLTKDEIIKFAASVETKSSHPIAKAIVEFSAEFLPVTSFENIEDKGVSGFVEGRNVRIVNVDYLIEQKIKYDSQKYRDMKESGKTVTYVLIDNELFGAIVLSDSLRAESKLVIKQLKKMKIKTLVMTADSKSTAHWLTKELQLDDYIAEIPKAERVNKIKELQSNGRIIGITGNGISDKDILDKADVGFAIGTGLDINSISGDIFLFQKKPLDIIRIIKMSKLTYKKTVQNVVWVILYCFSTLILSTGIFTKWHSIVTPSLSALLAFLGTLVVILNSKFHHIVK